MENKFIKPDHPFLLLTEDMDGNVSYCWWDTEEKMLLREENLERGLFMPLKFLPTEM